MQKIIFLESRKAVALLGVLRSLVLSVAVVFVVIQVWGNLHSVVYAGEGAALGQTGTTALNAFQKAMILVANGTNTEVIIPQISLTSEQVLAVFGPQPEYTLYDTCAGNEEVKKPLSMCEPNQFCICIYDEDQLDELPYDCKNVHAGSFTDVYSEPYEQFTANLGGSFDYDQNGNPTKANTLIYADCWASGDTLGIRNILIRKKQEGTINAIKYIEISDEVCENKGKGTCKTECAQNEMHNESLPCYARPGSAAPSRCCVRKPANPVS